MESFGLVLGALGGVALGILGGLKVGGMVRERPAALFWALNAAVFVIGVVATTFGFAWDLRWLVLGGVAFIGGGMTGLKYGYGRSVGAWRLHDEFMHSDADLRD